MTQNTNSMSSTSCIAPDDVIFIKVKDLKPVLSIEVPLLSATNDPQTFFRLMGGEKKVLKSVHDKSAMLIMKLSETDPLRGHVEGHIFPTSTILVRIRRKKQISTSNISSSSSGNSGIPDLPAIEAVGIISETLRFNHPADIQFLPSSTHTTLSATKDSSILEAIPRPFIKPRMEVNATYKLLHILI